MTLKRAGTDTTPTRPADPLDEVPATIPRTHQGRPQVAPPGARGVDAGVKLTSYTRASGLGKCLEDEHGLTAWKLRMVAFGLSRRDDLVMAAAALSTATDADDKKRLGELAEQAMEAAKTSAGATRGTALHLLTEREDAGENLSYLPAPVLAALAAWRRLMAGFRVHATETFVVNDDLRAAGSFDRLVSPLGAMRAPDGTTYGPGDLLGVDLKSNKSAEHFGPTYKVQQAVYFGEGTTPYTHERGRLDWSEIGEGIEPGARPDGRWSLIPHVPIESPGDAGLWWVDLAEGGELAQLAAQVRKVRGRKGLLPAELPVVEPAPVDVPTQRGTVFDLLAAIGVTVEADALGDLYDQHAAVWTDEHTAAAKARLAELDRARLTQGEVIGALRAATTRAELDALYDEHADKFTPYVVEVARACAEKLTAVPA